MFISETLNTVREMLRSSEQGLITGRGTSPLQTYRAQQEICLVHEVQIPSSVLPFSGYRGSFQGIKRSGRKADRLPESSVEITTTWS